MKQVWIIFTTMLCGVYLTNAANAMVTYQQFPTDYPATPVGGGPAYIATHIADSAGYSTHFRTEAHQQSWNSHRMANFNIYTQILVDPRKNSSTTKPSNKWSTSIELPGVKNGQMQVAEHSSLLVVVSNAKIVSAGDGGTAPYLYTWHIEAVTDSTVKNWDCILTWDGNDGWYWHHYPNPVCVLQ